MGQSIGHDGQTVGEVVFNTSMTGYQEILSDPSYNQQLVTLTYSHIGNYGVNSEDNESSAVHAAGLIIKNLPITHSNFRATDDLSAYLKSSGTVAITLPASVTSALPVRACVYDLFMTSPAGIRTQLLKGSVLVSMRITRG